MAKNTKSFALTLLTFLLVLVTLSLKHKFKSAEDLTIFFLTSVGGATDHTATQNLH